MLKSNLNSTISKIIDSLLALFLILNCQSIFQNSVAANYHIYEFTLTFVILSMVIKYFEYPLNLEKLNHIAAFSFIYLISAIFLLMFCVAKSDWLSFSARFLIAPLILLYFVPICCVKAKMQVFKYFVTWTFIITAISLFFFTFGTNLNLIHPTGTFLYKWGNMHEVQSYHNLYFDGVQYVDVGLLKGVTFRNTAIFVEGPMYASVLDLSIFFLVLLRKYFKYFKLYLTVLTLGVITSNSTAALIIGLIIIFWSFKDSKFFVKTKNIFIFLLIIVFILIAFNLLQLKIGNLSTSSSSGMRMDDYVAGFKSWLHSPILGWGYNNMIEINKFRLNTANNGFSNSILAILNGGGLVFGFLYLFPIFYGCFNKQIYSSRIELCIVYFLLLVLILFYTSYINFFIWALLLDNNIWKNLQKGIIKEKDNSND